MYGGPSLGLSMCTARLGSAFCKLKNEVSRDLFGFPCGPLGPETHPRYLSCLINRIDVNLVFE